MTTTATKPKVTVSFYATSPNLRKVRVPTITKRTDYGAESVPGVSYEFKDHFLRVHEGQDALRDGPLDDQFEPTVQDAIGYLRRQAENLSPEQPDHFAEYHEPVPSSAGVLAEIMQAVEDRDADKLTAILDAEEEGHNREDVVKACMSGFHILEPDSPPEAA